MLMWEDGFCRTRAAEVDGAEDPVRKAFSKMSIQLYNYGEGLMGKVASDKCHKWIFKQATSSPSSECEPNVANFWQSSFDALPPEWTDQFGSGIQTIAVIHAGHGLLQLGSCKIIPEDLHFVLRMRHIFESLSYQSGFHFSNIFSSPSSSLAAATVPAAPTALAAPPVYNWSNRTIHHAFHVGIPDGCHLEDPDIKWPAGLSFFNALTTRADDAELLFGSTADAPMGNKTVTAAGSHHRVSLGEIDDHCVEHRD
ncbi:protein RICE SALT SENSITIVE 3-like [Wolffia australiana]